MRTPNPPIALMAKITRERGRAVPDDVLDLLTALVDTRRACSYFEGQVYSLTYERDRLKAENEFLCKLINLKLEELTC